MSSEITEIDALIGAQKFLKSINVGFLLPGRIVTASEKGYEVSFLVPETLNPMVAVIDPCDVRVWIDIAGLEINLIVQM